MRSLCQAAIGAIILFASVAVQPASASPIAESFSFSFNNFISFPYAGSIATVDPWSGQFTATFDPIDPSGAIQEGALDSFTSNLAPGIAGTGTWDFVYFVFNGETHLSIQSGCSSSGCAADFGLLLSPLSTNGAAYIANGTDYYSLTGTVTQLTAAVPEPGALALLGGGLVSLVGLLRRRQRKTIAA